MVVGGFCILLSHLVDAFVVQRPRWSIAQHCQSKITVRSSFDNAFDDELTPAEVKELTVPQLKQQLRLRGLKVTGKKQDLIDRLLSVTASKFSDPVTKEVPLEADLLSESESKEAKPKSKAQKVAEEHGKEFIDVTAYLDEEDAGKEVKSSIPINGEEPEEVNAPSSNPETWGSEAKIVDDYEGRSPVVDGMSRTVIEYKGSNQTSAQAFVVASRDALRPGTRVVYGSTWPSCSLRRSSYRCSQWKCHLCCCCRSCG